MKRILVSLLIALLIGIGITPVLLFVTAFAEMQWKTEVVTCALFPYGTIMNDAIFRTHTGENMGLNFIDLALFGIQYPLYGIVIALANTSRRSALIASLIVLLLHAIAVVASITYSLWR